MLALSTEEVENLRSESGAELVENRRTRCFRHQERRWNIMILWTSKDVRLVFRLPWRTEYDG